MDGPRLEQGAHNNGLKLEINSEGAFLIWNHSKTAMKVNFKLIKRLVV